MLPMRQTQCHGRHFFAGKTCDETRCLLSDTSHQFLHRRIRDALHASFFLQEKSNLTLLHAPLYRIFTKTDKPNRLLTILSTVYLWLLMTLPLSNTLEINDSPD